MLFLNSEENYNIQIAACTHAAFFTASDSTQTPVGFA